MKINSRWWLAAVSVLLGTEGMASTLQYTVSAPTVLNATTLFSFLGRPADWHPADPASDDYFFIDNDRFQPQIPKFDHSLGRLDAVYFGVDVPYVGEAGVDSSAFIDPGLVSAAVLKADAVLSLRYSPSSSTAVDLVDQTVTISKGCVGAPGAPCTTQDRHIGGHFGGESGNVLSDIGVDVLVGDPGETLDAIDLAIGLPLKADFPVLYNLADAEGYAFLDLALSAPGSISVTYDYTPGVTLYPTPLPAAFWLFSSVVAGFGFMRRKAARKA